MTIYNPQGPHTHFHDHDCTGAGVNMAPPLSGRQVRCMALFINSGNAAANQIAVQDVSSGNVLWSTVFPAGVISPGVFVPLHLISGPAVGSTLKIISAVANVFASFDWDYV